MPRAARLLLAAAVALLAAGMGFYAATALAPERLHSEVEAWLSRATRSPADVENLRLVLGFPLRIEGSGLSLYAGALTVERASARLDPIALLLGRPRLSRLRLDGAHLQVDRTPEGAWEPPIFGPPGNEEHPEPALAPLRLIERVTRSMLTRPLLADTLIVRRSRVSLVHPDPAGGGDPVRLVFEGVNGRLLHSRLFGDARLFLRVRVESGGEERGRFEWQGTRDEEGAMAATMAATGLDLSALVPYVRGARTHATLAGTLDGIADFETAESGVGRLELDLAVRDLETSLAHEASIAATAEPLRLPQLSLRMGVDLDHERVVLRDARIGTQNFDFALDAEIARPLRDASRARVTVALGELVLKTETAEKLAGWLPASGRESLTSLAERVRSGRLLAASLRGVAPVARWRRVITGSLERLPAGFAFAARFDDLAIDVDEANRLDDLEAEMRYQDDTLEVADAAGQLNGGPLPGLSIRFEGLSRVLATPLEDREMASSAQALVGLTPLFEFLRREPDPEAPPREPPPIELTFEHLHHPALLWPLHDVRVELALQPDADGVLLRVDQCAWGGVRLDGEVDWTLRPDRHLDIQLVASELSSEGRLPATSPPVEMADSEAPDDMEEPWVRGHFRVGPIDAPSWSQSGATGRFSAAGGELRIEDLEVGMRPSGRVAGWVDLLLTEEDRVPYQADLDLDGANLGTLILQRGASREYASGTLDASAEIEGNLIPGRTLLHDADGLVTLDARDGAIDRGVPPVLALALASSSLNPFSRREQLRYHEARSDLLIEKGRLSTSGLEIDGPDIRLFASGGLDLSATRPTVDAEVVLFLFRQVDRALELIPIVNVLLLGENQNLLAAYFQLSGPWAEPVARAKPLRTLQEGPGSVLTKGIPRVMLRGMEAIGGLFRSGDNGAPPEAGEAEENGSAASTAPVVPESERERAPDATPVAP